MERIVFCFFLQGGSGVVLRWRYAQFWKLERLEPSANSLRMDLRINVFEELTGKSIYQFESQTFCCCHVVGLLKIIISPFMLKKTLLGKRHFQLWSYPWLFKWVRTVLKHVFFPKSFIPADNSRQQAGHCCRKCVELFVRKVETLRKLTNKTYEHFVWWIPTYAKWRELRCVTFLFVRKFGEYGPRCDVTTSEVDDGVKRTRHAKSTVCGGLRRCVRWNTGSTKCWEGWWNAVRDSDSWCFEH